MNKKELTILIPVDETISTKHGFKMLRPDMLMGYHRQSNGRVLRSDTVEQSGNKFTLDYPFVKREDIKNLKVNNDKTGHHLSIELTITDKPEIDVEKIAMAVIKPVNIIKKPKLKIKPKSKEDKT
jgi:hypothetical protein